MDKDQLFKDFEKRLREGKMDRRDFLQGAGKLAIASLGLTVMASLKGGTIDAAPKFSSYPFTLGVTSGDPWPESVVLWTRLAPDPLNGGGMSGSDVPVKWEVASDENFRKVVREGTAFARAQLGHSVHVEVDKLKPNQVYYYRFKAGKEISPTGRTKTLPVYGSQVDKLSFAFASCQNYPTGYFNAYRHMAEEQDLDLVFHLGDYIYEGPGPAATTPSPRYHNGPEIITLEDYRNRYALYKSDSDLQAAHAQFPWVVAMDDHEIENNHAGLIPENNQPVGPFLARKAAAFQAYYENMPLRSSSLPSGFTMQLYRQFHYGNLANIHVLDTRQFRDDQASGDGRKPPTPESTSVDRSIMGEEQEQWLLSGLYQSQASWNIIPQQVFFCKRDFLIGDGVEYSMDGWDGYTANRERITNFAKEQGLSNLVILTGDVHSNWACEIKADFENPNSEILGAEFVGTSITSGGDGYDINDNQKAILAENPHIKFYNNQRGYVRCTATHESFQADYKVVPYVTRPGAPISTRASFLMEKGKPGLKQIHDAAVTI
ncbi:alkaline phosphatase D family protein [Paenibacillus sp. N4]|uniref:alkaline phosphatase D family protein n=1 Tax=Paenibacillus vietnamensis TaxID=2590547 RepID=UPI001CD0CB82|nr:alkaline phosphatase D family protein [Paenibacillus vietnamensis]MCA0754239.1 alkaline phosphatase D family protein [Paenibacillus vietnamensis]